MKFFEDFTVGETSEFGNYAVTREEVLDFAAKYDPQPFHLDDEAAAKTFFGKISASGWHTCAMTMRMLVDQMQATKSAAEGSPGVEDIRWRRPVYPGDTLHVRSRVDGKTDIPSKPHLGIVHNCHEVLNQDDVIVMTFKAGVLMRRRESQ